jgi:hypothetical protein
MTKCFLYSVPTRVVETFTLRTNRWHYSRYEPNKCCNVAYLYRAIEKKNRVGFDQKFQLAIRKISIISLKSEIEILIFIKECELIINNYNVSNLSTIASKIYVCNQCNKSKKLKIVKLTGA